MRILRTGDPCPCCGQPIRLTQPEALRLLGIVADMLGLPCEAAPAGGEEDGYSVQP